MSSELPETWARMPIRDLGDWTGGGTPSKSEPSFWSAGTVPWVSPKDMKSPRIRDSIDHITEEAVRRSTAKLVPPRSVLVVTRSGILAHTLPVAVTEVPVTVNQDLKALIPRAGVDPDYAAYALRTHASEILKECTKHGTTVHNVNTNLLMRFEIPVAPLAEQRRVAEALDSYMSRLDQAATGLERIQLNLARYRASVLQAAVEGRLVPTEAELARAEGRDYEPASELLKRILAERRGAAEDGGSRGIRERTANTRDLHKLPDGWCWTTLEQLLMMRLSNGRSVRTATNGFPVLRLTALKGEHVDLSERKTGAWSLEEARSYLVSKGDLLIARGNGSLRLVGRGALVESEPDLVAFPDTLIRARLDTRIYEPRLFALVWNSAWIRAQIERTARTTAGIFKVNQEDLNRCAVPLPPLAEQARLLHELDKQLSVAESLEVSVSHATGRCEGLRQAILRSAFGGALVDQDPNDEPATALLDRIRRERMTGSDTSPRQARSRVRKRR